MILNRAFGTFCYYNQVNDNTVKKKKNAVFFTLKEPTGNIKNGLSKVVMGKFNIFYYRLLFIFL